MCTRRAAACSFARSAWRIERKIETHLRVVAMQESLISLFCWLFLVGFWSGGCRQANLRTKIINATNKWFLIPSCGSLWWLRWNPWFICNTLCSSTFTTWINWLHTLLLPSSSISVPVNLGKRKLRMKIINMTNKWHLSLSCGSL